MLFAREAIGQPLLADAAIVVHDAVVGAVLGAAGSAAGCPAAAPSAAAAVEVGMVGVGGEASACNVASCGELTSCHLSRSCASFAATADRATAARATATTSAAAATPSAAAATTSAAAATTASQHLGGRRAAATLVVATLVVASF